MKLTEGGLLR